MLQRFPMFAYIPAKDMARARSPGGWLPHAMAMETAILRVCQAPGGMED